MNERRAVLFYLNGVLQEICPASPTQTVLQFLREQKRLVGTKEGCAEGDCGACTVTEASLDADGNLRYRSINACIRFLPTLDGHAIWTVEGLPQADSGLHPVQQALVDHHGSQCGFCTPGFVMSMYTMYQLGERHPKRDEVLDHLSGNLCRCTGYRPIIDAAMDMGSYPDVDAQHDLWSQKLQVLAKRCEIPLVLRTPEQEYCAPTTVKDLTDRYVDQPDAVLLAGGTDVGLWVTKQMKTLPSIIYLGRVLELERIEHRDGYLQIGANVLLNDGYAAVVEQYPECTELWKRFASMPIRNSGTLVGNLANGSPIGDSAPFLISIGARLLLRKGDVVRELALEDLYLDYRKQNREPGEFVQAVRIPLRSATMNIATYKLSKRFDQDISAVCSAYAMSLVDGRVTSIRIAHGGMAATSKRAAATEQALLGQLWDAGTVRRGMLAIAQDYQPLTDMRASGDYRLKAAQNLLFRFFLESTAIADTRV